LLVESAPTKRTTIRAFIAVYPEREVAEKLENVQSLLRQQLADADIRWARPEQLHLTLQFLGHFAPDRLASFEQAIAHSVAGKVSFNLASEGLGCFPSGNRPRILWAGLTGDIPALQQIKTELDASLSALGYEPEKRAFHPHITLARIGEIKRRDVAQFQKEINEYRSKHFGKWHAGEVRLMQSLLSPSGAKYVVLKNFPLNQNKASVV